MEIKVLSEKQNPMLKRREISFRVEHGQSGSTPSRQDVRRAVATILKIEENVVFLKKLQTRTGTQTAIGLVNVYETVEQAKRVEPEYIVKRNLPPEKPKEEKKG